MICIFHKRAARRAFTLTELAIVLGIMSIALGGIWVAGAKVWEDYQAYRTQSYVLQTVQNIREYYASKSLDLMPRGTTAPYLITPALDAALVLPVDMRVNKNAANGVLRHPFGGNFLVVRDCSGGVAPCTPDTNSFRIRLEGLSQGACTKLLMAMPVTVQEAGLIGFWTYAAGADTTENSISLDARGQWQYTGTMANVRLPLAASIAQNWCRLAGKTNIIDMHFRIRV